MIFTAVKNVWVLEEVTWCNYFLMKSSLPVRPGNPPGKATLTTRWWEVAAPRCCKVIFTAHNSPTKPQIVVFTLLFVYGLNKQHQSMLVCEL